ncbi:ATP-grasp domain-containing protein, partial [Patescibacteria group bacterium]|nr:ATP-grasp domain-containing protein [Patescibacteria group bacterium]
MINLKQYKSFLTKNERNKIYLKENSAVGRLIADRKWKTKKILAEAGVGVPALINRFKDAESVDGFAWEKLEGNFVIKPASGYGGEGIVVVRNRGKWAGEWKKMDGVIVNIADLKLHCREILEGKYSLHGMRDTVLLEERVKIHPKFLCLTKFGTPDIRVIVYNNVPVMAMFRVPTEESGGKANLQQGAIGLGLDLATGITTFGIVGKSELIEKIYDYKKKKKIKVNGIKVPEWELILETAIGCQRAIPFLGFMGIDILLDKDKGPMVLEVNA